MINELKRPVAWLCDGNLKQLGSIDGPSDAIIEDALDEMKGFVRLAIPVTYQYFWVVRRLMM